MGKGYGGKVFLGCYWEHIGENIENLRSKEGTHGELDLNMLRT
jgi:hypothetical protein